MMSKLTHALLSGIALCLSGMASAQQQSWDAVGDFDFSNPSNTSVSDPWSYESSTGLLTMSTAACFGTPGLFCWHGGGPFDTPFVGINTTTMPFVTGGGHVIAESVLIVHPGQNVGERVKVRWTAYSSGLYRFVGHFQLIDKNAPANGVIAEIRCSSCASPMATFTFSGFGTTRIFNKARFIGAGKSVTFEVDNNGSYNHDSTALKVAVLRL
jgi:hypothetical protein